MRQAQQDIYILGMRVQHYLIICMHDTMVETSSFVLKTLIKNEALTAAKKAN